MHFIKSLCFFINGGGSMKKILISFFLTISIFSFSYYITDLSTDTLTINWYTQDESFTSVIFDGKTFLGERGKFHHVSVGNLKPGKEYTFSIIKGKNSLLNENIRTLSNDNRDFIVYGDNRENSSYHDFILTKIKEESFDFIFNTGDMVFLDLFWWQWEKFSEIISELNKPYFPVIGNHEFPMFYINNVFPGIEENTYYYFVSGDSIFIVLNSNKPLDENSAQYEWFKKILDNSENYKYKFVFMHKPPFSNGPHGNNDQAINFIVPLMEQHKVNIVFSGHDHSYQRFEKNGVIYIVTAGAGAPLYDLEGKNEGLIIQKKINNYVLCEYSEESGTYVITAKDTNNGVIDQFDLR
ncbi:MAG: acid phosphatase type 7 [Kosmotogales bacterium]|nr:acid phosphatase type 7 [Kosmotogales bacterium]